MMKAIVVLLRLIGLQAPITRAPLLVCVLLLQALPLQHGNNYRVGTLRNHRHVALLPVRGSDILRNAPGQIKYANILRHVRWKRQPVDPVDISSISCCSSSSREIDLDKQLKKKIQEFQDLTEAFEQAFSAGRMLTKLRTRIENIKSYFVYVWSKAQVASRKVWSKAQDASRKVWSEAQDASRKVASALKKSLTLPEALFKLLLKMEARKRLVEFVNDRKAAGARKHAIVQVQDHPHTWLKNALEISSRPLTLPERLLKWISERDW